MKVRVLRPQIMVVISLLGLFLSVSAFSDTFNFYFPKKTEAERPYPHPNSVEEFENLGQETDEVPSEIESDVAEKKLSERVSPTRTAAASPWKLGVCGILKFNNTLAGSPFSTESYYPNPDYGGLVSLKYSFNATFGANFYGGAAAGNTADPYFGADVEALPFRFATRESWNWLELGVLAGASSAAAATGNAGSLHAGIRMNFNLGPSLGFTVGGRGNLGYAMLEAGLTTGL